MSTLFSICSDIDHAKTVCPKFCGLCNVVDGSWSGWSSWSQCDVTCEKGTQSRTRLCNNPAPKNGGQKCQGSNVTTKPCVREVCPVDGGWSAWEAWKSCSTTCDMGLQSRTRNCSNPFPAHNGQHCFGHNLDVRQCLPGPCANGGWSNWGNWSPCTATCGNGIRSTSRSCTKPPPSPYGQYCIGEHFKMESCAEMECDLSHCQPDPCEHGSCLDLLHDFSCSCNKGFEGRYCNISTSACKSNPCVHGTCYDGEHDYVCVCNDGYRGKQCSISIDYCLSSPCIRGTCINNDTNFTCVCPPGVTGVNCERIPASDCYDILKLNPGSRSGIYWVQLWKTHQYIEVLCDLETAGGGWTVFQRRFNGSVDFGENFVNYTKGFGNKNGEFWLGLHYIYEMTSQGRSELRLDLMSADQTEVYEVFPDFYISSGPAYTLHIGHGVGTAGDAGEGLSFHNGHNFHTYDHDDSDSCSSRRGHAGWWFFNCAYVNLNGQYVTPGTVHPQSGESGIIYFDFQQHKSLKSTRMMFRRT